MTPSAPAMRPHSAHWGVFSAAWHEGALHLRPHPRDPDPNPLIEDVMRGVVQLPTGAWYDPGTDAQGRPLCVHGNPNALTRDEGTSSLAQGCVGQLTAVEVERFDEALPEIRAYDPPPG